MNVLDLGDSFINMYWMMHADIKERKDESGAPFEDPEYDITFYFADARGANKRVRVGEEGLDTIREALNE